jgi:hypothetical protein
VDHAFFGTIFSWMRRPLVLLSAFDTVEGLVEHGLRSRGTATQRSVAARSLGRSHLGVGLCDVFRRVARRRASMQFNGDVLPIVQIHRFPRMELCQPLGARPDPLLMFGCHESAAEGLALHLDARACSTILKGLRPPRLPLAVIWRPRS